MRTWRGWGGAEASSGIRLRPAPRPVSPPAFFCSLGGAARLHPSGLQNYLAAVGEDERPGGGGPKGRGRKGREEPTCVTVRERRQSESLRALWLQPRGLPGKARSGRQWKGGGLVGGRGGRAEDRFLGQGSGSV